MSAHAGPTRFLRCEHCGGLADPASVRCRYCGAAPVPCDDLIAAAFGGEGTPTWEITPPVEGARLEITGTRQLAIELPPRTEVPGSTMPCAWTRGDFVDVDASVAIAFDGAPKGLAAGLWLRSTDPSRLWVTLHASGQVSASVMRMVPGKPPEETRLGTIPARAGFGPGVVTLLRARVVRDVLTVFVDGVPGGAMLVPTDFAGSVDLFVQVAAEERATVLFIDPSARLP